MKTKPEILFAAFEATPFMKTGGLGDVAGSLPKALLSAGADVRLILPKFGTIAEKYKKKMEHVADFYLDLSWRHQYCGVETMKLGRLTCYFIDNEFYFKRGRAYGYGDDGERVAFFSKAVLEALKYIQDFRPRILHCNDWHTALIPVFLRSQYAGISRYDGIKTVFTVHNLKFQGIYPQWLTGEVLGLDSEQARHMGMFYDDTVNFLRGALCTSDVLTTVSPTYAEEICTAFYGERAQDIFNSRRGDLYGILNGIDVKQYDPMTDKNLFAPFSAADLSGKRENKLALQRQLGLEEDPDIPLLGLVSRLTEQKGLDLLVWILAELIGEGVQLVVLGLGDEKYENSFRSMAAAAPDRMAALITFDEPLSHKLYAACDMMLVPSLFEPCGLTQMIAMRYGTLPVVRETGGLKDSVIPYNKYTGEGNGFSFANYNAHELLFTLKDAVQVYRENKAAWAGMVQNAMAADFSWAVSAAKYMELYRKLLQA